MNLSEKSMSNENSASTMQRVTAESKPKHSDFRRFIVLTRSRTGSNMLLSFLNSHPNIYSEGEVFNRLNGRACKDVLSRVFADQPGHIKAKGFKIFYYHPLDDDSGQIWAELKALQNLHVIHLKRRNIFRTVISRKIAGYHDVWVARSADGHDRGQSKAVSFTKKELGRWFKQTREWEAWGEQQFSSHPLLSIEYEDLVHPPEDTFRKVTDFLGVQYAPPKTTLKRQNPEKLSELVTNYSELKDAFAGTEWQEFFEE